MTDTAIQALLWFCAVGCGVMAGAYFTFSAFVMSSLAKIDTAAGIGAMQSINDVILRSAFMPLFFGTSVASVISVLIAVSDLSADRALWMAIGGATYFVGMFLVTVFFNVPLNNKLKAVDASSASGAEMWDRYLRNWTPWNHVRTVVSIVACIFFIIAI